VATCGPSVKRVIREESSRRAGLAINYPPGIGGWNSDVMAEKNEDQAFTLANSASHLLHRALQMAADHFNENFRDPNLTLRQFAVLAALAKSDGLSQVELVRATGIDRSTLADMVARMEDRELLAREKSSKDRRAKLVRLTQRGRVKLSEAIPHAAAADQALLAGIARPRQRILVEVLTGLAAAADELADANLNISKRKKTKETAKGGKAAKSKSKLKRKKSK
jgi:DNA-binding MarR family transcriptional regulator